MPLCGGVSELPGHRIKSLIESRGNERKYTLQINSLTPLALRLFCARGDVCFDDGDTEDVHGLSYVRCEVSLRDATEAYLVRRLREKITICK
jgi:hypothetical protein